VAGVSEIADEGILKENISENLLGMLEEIDDQ